MESQTNYEKTQTHQFESREAYEAFIDQYLGDDYIAEREIRNKKKAYIPIPMQESVADMVFSEWGPIDEKYTTFVNEVVCTIKIAYVPDYPGAQERIITGSASRAIQQSSGSQASQFPSGKITNSLEYNLPAVRKAAIGTALEQIGNIFGRNVGRTTQIGAIEPDFSFRAANRKEVNNG